MNATMPKTAQLSQTMAELLQSHSTLTVFRTLIAQRLAVRQNRPPPFRMADLPPALLRDLGLHEPRDTD
jgi:hypothetical protein